MILENLYDRYIGINGSMQGGGGLMYIHEGVTFVVGVRKCGKNITRNITREEDFVYSISIVGSNNDSL